MTKERFQAKLKLLENLNFLANDLEAEILDDLEDLGASANDAQITELFANFKNGGYSTHTLMDALDEYLSKLNKGEEINPPVIKIDSLTDIQVNVPLKDGSSIEANITDLDGSGSKQAFVCYKTEKGDMLDLCGAECKKGDLAKSNGLPENNKDIDIYTYADPYNEDYTSKETIKYEDIQNALEPEGEMEQE